MAGLVVLNRLFFHEESMKLERDCCSGVSEELKGRIGNGYDQNTMYTHMKLSKNKLTLKNHGFSITLIQLETIINHSCGHISLYPIKTSQLTHLLWWGVHLVSSLMLLTLISLCRKCSQFFWAIMLDENLG